MEQNIDGPIESWSDDQLLKAYRYLTGDLDRTEPNRPDVSAITEEMRRRGLSSSQVPNGFPKSEGVEWGRR